MSVKAAKTDLTNNNGLKLAREVDPEGIRTIDVLTKVDLVDEGTDVINILTGRITSPRYGYISSSINSYIGSIITFYFSKLIIFLFN